MPDDRRPPCSPRVLVTLPPAVVRLFPGSSAEVELAASTVGEAIEALDRRWPGMRDRLCDSTPRLRRTVNIFVEGERATLETSLRPGAEVVVLAAVIG